MTNNDIKILALSNIAIDGSIYNRGNIKKLTKEQIYEINKVHNTNDIMEAFYISVNGKKLCNCCNSKYPIFMSFKRGYKKTCKKCNHLNNESDRNIYISFIENLDIDIKKKLKLSHFRWIKFIYDNFKFENNYLGVFNKSYFKIFVENDYKLTNEELLNKIKKLQSYGKSFTLEKCIELYGKKEGIIVYQNWLDKQKGKGSLEHHIKKYGEVDGTKIYKERNLKRDSSSLEFMVKKYGEVDGPIKYKNKCELQKINSTREYMIEQLGEKEGNLKYDNMIYKIKSNIKNSKEYYIKRDIPLEEAKKLITERQITFSKEICINKHGEEKGLEIWKERQDKWQSTLNLKSDEEMLSINKRKNPGFKWFVKYMNITNEEAITILDSIDRDKFYKYNKSVFDISNEIYYKNIDEIDPKRLRGRTENGLYHLDHKFSRLLGFILNIPPVIIATKNNLEILSARDNITKSLRCSISKEQLYNYFYKDLSYIDYNYEKEGEA